MSQISLLLMKKCFFPNEERQPGQRIKEYAACIVPSYSDDTFQSHFRLSRSGAEILVGLLARCPEVPSQHLRGRPPVSVEKQLLITMWVLGNPETVRFVSDRFCSLTYIVFLISLSPKPII